MRDDRFVHSSYHPNVIQSNGRLEATTWVHSQNAAKQSKHHGLQRIFDRVILGKYKNLKEKRNTGLMKKKIQVLMMRVAMKENQKMMKMAMRKKTMLGLPILMRMVVRRVISLPSWLNCQH